MAQHWRRWRNERRAGHTTELTDVNGARQHKGPARRRICRSRSGDPPAGAPRPDMRIGRSAKVAADGLQVARRSGHQSEKRRLLPCSRRVEEKAWRAREGWRQSGAHTPKDLPQWRDRSASRSDQRTAAATSRTKPATKRARPGQFDLIFGRLSP